jgi:hypothetical protein
MSNFDAFQQARFILDNANPINDLAARLRKEEDATGLSQSKYDFNYRVFPEDLSADYQGHYMIININVPVNTLGGVRPRGLYISPNQTGSLGQNFGSELLPDELSKVDALRFAGAEGRFNNSEIVGREETISIKRGTRRIAESIALFMPSPVIFSSENKYEEISLTAFAGQAGKLGAIATAAGIAGLLTRSRQAAINVGRGVRGALNAAGQAAEFARQAVTLGGAPINPKVEVLFATTPQRQFVMEWLLAPKNEKESETIKRIVQTLRFHGAPELSYIGAGGLGAPSFIPPAEFDITFYNKGVENTHMPRINTCVLERIEVQYDPAGIYSTFRNGHPVGVRLSMSFRETEIIHKKRILQGF